MFDQLMGRLRARDFFAIFHLNFSNYYSRAAIHSPSLSAHFKNLLLKSHFSRYLLV